MPRIIIPMMIAGYHIIFGMYGFWLPNDPRGSWSKFVGSWELARYGRATTVNTRASVAAVPHDVRRRRVGKQALKYPAVQLSGRQARAMGRGFASYFAASDVKVWACAILPDHIHLVTSLGKHPLQVMTNLLKQQATQSLTREGLHPFQMLTDELGKVPKCFARGKWSVFLEPGDITRAIRYVERNPAKEGLPRQHWSFVTMPNIE